MIQLGILIILNLIIFNTYAQEPDADIKLIVEPDSGLYHKPLKIVASGFAPAQKVILQVDALDAEGNKWKSSAVFVADSLGIVNPGKSEPINGTYEGIHPMGLFWSMKSEDDHQIATGEGFSATIKVFLNGRIITSKTIYRRSSRELINIDLIKKRDSIVADLYLPETNGKLPAIIYLGGSGGQFRQERSSLLASEGFAVLNLKYFRYEGLPDGITEIPLEYVERAYKWLIEQPKINNENIGIMGRSMGSGLALLYAAHYSGLNYVIVEAPTNVVWFGWEDGKSSFTYQGRGFPYAEYTAKDSERIELEMKESGQQYHDGPKFLSAFNNKKMIEMASIPVEKIKCPILFISGEDDKVWPSSMMADMMIERLDNYNYVYDYKHISYENAGHNFAGGGQGCGIPFLPAEDYSNSSARGGTDKGNALAAIQSWSEILKFIEENSKE